MTGKFSAMAIVFITAMNVFSESKDTLSTKEIFRPQILPKGMWQLNSNKNFDFNVSTETEFLDMKEDVSFYLTTFVPARAYSDKLMMNSFPFPYFKYRISKFDILDENSTWTKKPSVVLGFGIPGLEVYRHERKNGYAVYRVNIPLEIDISLKKILNNKLFWLGNISIGNMFILNPFENFAHGTVYNTLGIQLTEKGCLNFGYEFSSSSSYTNNDIIMNHSVPVSLKVNINKSITAAIGSGISIFHNPSDNYTSIFWPVYTNITCQW